MKDMVRFITLLPLLLISASVSVESRNEKLEVRRAWALMEAGELDQSIEAVKPFLETRDAEVALAIAHLYNERAIQDGDYALEKRRSDSLCFIKMLERSAVLGDLGAASTLSASFLLDRRYLDRNSDHSKCWEDVAEGKKDAEKCIGGSAQDVCK
jgi:hypothetical protein